MVHLLSKNSNYNGKKILFRENTPPEAKNFPDFAVNIMFFLKEFDGFAL